MQLKGKKIIVGISGGIAAYKICELVRLFVKEQAEVRVVMTPSASYFVSPLTLSVLSKNEVLINMFPEVNPTITEKVNLQTWHVYSGVWADLMIVAPATASTIGKICSGISDNFLTATVLSSRCDVLVVPSMDEDMYLNEITQNNINKLKQSGYLVMEPSSGELASGIVGVGRLPEPQLILNKTIELLNDHHKDLNGKNILITAGPTYEEIDKVRFISNYSSGKMGFNLARAAKIRGASVTLISGPVNENSVKGVNIVKVKSADEMYNAVMKIKDEQDIIIMAAAVADYKPKSYFKGKIKKSDQNLSIELVKTKDILKELGSGKRKYKLVGFALETENINEYAIDKLERKNLDLIVANNPEVEGAGFGTDTNVATIIDKNKNIKQTSKISKFELSNTILDIIKDSN